MRHLPAISFDAKRLLTERKSKGLSQEALSREAGVTLRAYIRWERGETAPYGQNLIRLARFFEVNPGDFYIVEDAR